MKIETIKGKIDDMIFPNPQMGNLMKAFVDAAKLDGQRETLREYKYIIKTTRIELALLRRAKKECEIMTIDLTKNLILIN